MSRFFRIFVFASVLWVVSATANASLFTGSLQYTPPYPADSGDGLIVGPSSLQWAQDVVTLAWTVTDNDTSQPGFPWKYTYHLTLVGSEQAGFSHMIIEASPSFCASDLAGLDNGSLYSVTTQFANQGNANMPEDIYGIKLNPPAEGMLDWTVSFFSDRAPVWGDFYARCGGKKGGINYAYNKGFLSPDTDPATPASDGSVDFHILRPDTVVPEPTTLTLLILAGLGGMASLWRRK
jgi:hypothetical protein